MAGGVGVEGAGRGGGGGGGGGDAVRSDRKGREGERSGGWLCEKKVWSGIGEVPLRVWKGTADEVNSTHVIPGGLERGRGVGGCMGVRGIWLGGFPEIIKKGLACS